MANSKISALTSATTPLAGTETLPIVQSSTTKKVAVSDLTAGRAVSVGSLSSSGSISGTTGDFSGRISTTVGNNEFALRSTGATTGFNVVSINNTGGQAIFGQENSTGNNLIVGASGYDTIIRGETGLAFSANAGSNLQMRISSTGNITANVGNLIIGTSGKGIDFSATPGTGTSELLADYEEGTWTPVVAAGAISGTNKAYVGTYTKIGRAVTITFKAYSTSSSNDLVVASYVGFSGLPFTSTYGGTSFTSTEDIDIKRGGEIAVGDSSTTLYLGACGASPGTNSIFGSLTYIV